MKFVLKLHFDPDDYDMAEEESKRLESYNHPNIVKHIDGFEYNKFEKFAIVMEHCQGNNPSH